MATTRSISTPYPIYQEADGSPLEDGYIYIGEINQNPEDENYRISVYWDEALTIPAEQPIRTLGGYPVRSGTPARLYAASDYSTTVRDKNLVFIYSAPTSTEAIPVSVVNGTAERWYYTAGTPEGDYTGSLTDFPVSYDVGFVDAYLDGVKLTDDDFTATSGTAIILPAVTSGQRIDIIAYGVFEVANHYTKAEADALFPVKSNVLELDNTTAFTPDADYEPSTKKYADDVEAAAKAYADTLIYIEMDHVETDVTTDIAIPALAKAVILKGSTGSASAFVDAVFYDDATLLFTIPIAGDSNNTTSSWRGRGAVQIPILKDKTSSVVPNKITKSSVGTSTLTVQCWIY